MDGKQDPVYADLLVIMMISVYAVLILSNKLSHTVIILSVSQGF